MSKLRLVVVTEPEVVIPPFVSIANCPDDPKFAVVADALPLTLKSPDVFNAPLPSIDSPAMTLLGSLNPAATETRI